MVSTFIFGLLVKFATVAYAVDLLTALRASNASIFADKIERDNDLKALYLGKDVQTVFVPIDSVFLKHMNLEQIGATKKEEDPAAAYAAIVSQSKFSFQTPEEILTSASKNVPANTEDGTQKATTEGTAPGTHVKRNQTIYNPETQIKVVSGLGNKVSIVQSYIEYDGGYIHTIDGQLTIPLRLSRTLATLKDTTAFGAIINSSNLTTSLDIQRGGTFFIPSNDAISSLGNWTLSPNAIQGHVIKGYSAYLPSLAGCTSFTSANGEVLKVAKSSDGSFYINNAKILSTNIILENGVAYIIDKVLAAPTIPPPINNAASPTFGVSMMTIGGLTFSVLLAATLLV